MALPEELKKVVNNKVVPKMDSESSEDNYFNKMHLKVEDNASEILTNYLWIRNIIKEAIPWKLKNIRTRKFSMRDVYPSPFVLQFIDRVDIREGTKFTPIMITYAAISPAIIPRDLQCSYKVHWVSTDLTDDMLNTMVNNLNHEHPGLDRLLERFFTGEKGKDTYTYLYKDYEKKSRKEKIPIERTLHEPFQIKNVEIESVDDFSIAEGDKNEGWGLGDDEGEGSEKEQVSVLILSQFLKNERNKFKGARPPSLPMKIFEDTLNALGRYMLSNEEEGESELVAEEEEEEDSRLSIEKCPNCGWVLSKGKEICPMCNTDVTLLDTREESFSASTALESTENSRKTDKLLGSLKNLVEGEDEGVIEAQEKIKKTIEANLKEDKVAQQLISSRGKEGEAAIENNHPLVKTLENELNLLEPRVFHAFELQIQELSFKELLVAEIMLKEDFTDYHPGLISYITTVPKLPSDLILDARINPMTERREIKWVSKGEDFGISKKLNSLKFKEFTMDVFGGEEQKYASHFQAKRLDALDRLKPVEGMEYELPFMVKVSRFHPRLKKAPEDKNYIILNHFLKSEAEGYSGMIPVNEILVLLDAVIAGIKISLGKLKGMEGGEEQGEEESEEPEDMSEEDLVDGSILGDDEDYWDEEEEDELDLSNLDTAIGDVEEPEEEETEESLLDTIKGPSMKDVREMEMKEAREKLEQAKAQKQGSSAKASSNSKNQTVESQVESQLSPELFDKCKRYGIDPNMSKEDLNQKANEVKYQRENLSDMIRQAQESVSEGKMTAEQYQQQEDMIKLEMNKLNNQIMVIEELKDKL